MVARWVRWSIGEAASRRGAALPEGRQLPCCCVGQAAIPGLALYAFSVCLVRIEEHAFQV
jgi:hypothetical protein